MDVLGDASGFSVGDYVVRLRPRAQLVATINSAAGAVLKLNAPIGVVKGDVLAIGNLPRVAKVVSGSKGRIWPWF